MNVFNFIKRIFRRKEEYIDPLSHREEEIIRKEFIYTSTTSLQELFDFIAGEALNLTIDLKNGATEEEIDSFESKTFQLPDDFRQLYGFSNGFETSDWLFRVLPLQEIAENENSKMHASNSFHFAEYMIYSEIWSVELKEENKYLIYKQYEKEDRIVFTDSLAEFLSVYVNGGLFDGLLQWDLEISKKSTE